MEQICDKPKNNETTNLDDTSGEVTQEILTIVKRREKYLYKEHHPEKDVANGFRRLLKKRPACSAESAKHYILSRIPIINWLLLNYNFRTSFVGDVIAGLTVGVMHIPQGMGYAMLGLLDPICGIYMATFPVLVYTVFCTSMHCSVGSFAVINIMTGKTALSLATSLEDIPVNYSVRSGNATLEDIPISESVTILEISCVVALAVGFWNLLFGLLNFGSLCSYLSEMMISGFMTGASFHVFTSQLPLLLGLKLSTYQGPMSLVYMYAEIFSKISTCNYIAVIISVVCIVALLVNEEILKPIVKKYTVLPIPAGLILVILGTLSSSYFSLNEDHGVRIVDDIPVGIPQPSMPRLEYFIAVLFPSCIITVVGFMINISLAKTFSQRLEYDIDAKQELYAYGFSNICAGIFPCGPVAASLSRSMVQYTAGGITQLASIISCLLLCIVLISIASFFEPLPTCVLASIIVVALRELLMQYRDCIRMWNVSRLDSLLWLFTFFMSVIIDIDYGLILGIVASVLIMVGSTQKLTFCLIGRIPYTNLYLDVSKYGLAETVPGFCIAQVSGNISFANLESLRTGIIKISNIDPCRLKKEKKKVHEVGNVNESFSSQQDSTCCDSRSTSEIGNVISAGNLQVRASAVENGVNKISDVNEITGEGNIISGYQQSKRIVLDLGGVGSIDITGSKYLCSLLKEYSEIGVVLVYSGFAENILHQLATSKVLESIPEKCLFHSIHDAVLFLSSCEAPLQPEVTDTNL